jgi:hypothetical protein
VRSVACARGRREGCGVGGRESSSMSSIRAIVSTREMREER